MILRFILYVTNLGEDLINMGTYINRTSKTNEFIEFEKYTDCRCKTKNGNYPLEIFE